MTRNEVLGRVIPQFFPERWLDRPGLVFREFPSCIRIGYVLREEECYTYLCEGEFSGLSISLEELHAAALANLGRLPSGKTTIGKLPGGAEGYIHSAEDNFAAVRILLPQVQRVFRQAIGDEFLVSLPHRDDCFCWSSAQSAERQEKHARAALAAFLEEEYNLTPDILLCSQGHFRLHRRQVVPEPDCGTG